MRPILLAALVAACAPAHRETPMTTIAAFDPARYAGRWYEVARLSVPLQAGCEAAVADYAPLGDGSLAVVNACMAEAGRRVEGRARPTGPGRFEVAMAGASSPGKYWILWVDEGYRTAVVGEPSGGAAWVLNREPAIPPDRFRAAREILAWNGYDLSKLRMVRQ